MPPTYLRKPYKLMSLGVGLRHPVDLLPDGLYPSMLNMEVDVLGQLSVRKGITPLNGLTYPSPVHSMRRLQDLTNSTNALVVGAGTSLFTSASAVAIDTGYSGNPLSMVRFRPPSSPRPWMYIGDSNKQRKVLTDGTNYVTGIAPPAAAPTTARGVPVYNIIENFDSTGSWTQFGDAGTPSAAARFNTTITEVLYDTGTTGWCCILPAAITNVREGALCILDAAGINEVVKIRQVFQAITSTTIASILYDSGTSGPCSIVLTGQSTGLLPDSMLLLDSGGGTQEYVRVLSVSTGPDGQVSFRCSTANTQIPTHTVTGLATFRAFTVGTALSTKTITGNYLSTALTFSSGVGGLYIDYTGSTKNYAIAGPQPQASVAQTRPIQLSDFIHISILIDNPLSVSGGRIIFNTDPALPIAPFTALKNALYYNFTKSDFQSVISNTASTLSAQQTALQTQIINQQTQISDEQSLLNELLLAQTNPDAAIALGVTPGSQDLQDRINQLQALIASQQQGLNTLPSAAPVPGQVVDGTSQWTELVFPVSALAPVGSDPSRSLATVTGLIIQLQITASINVFVDSWYISGTYGPNSFQTPPYTIYQRYRSAVTGARSNPSPATRYALDLEDERMQINPVTSTDPQVDTIDLFAIGGTLTSPRLILSTANSASAVNFDSTDISNQTNEILNFNLFQPFPVIDLPRSGTCNVSGTTVQKTGGASFNTAWQAGSQIIINNVAYTLYSPPPSTTLLYLQENAGNQSGVNFSIPEATLGGQPLPSLWGPDPLTGVMFGVSGMDGYLRWTNPNDPDSANDANTYEVCSPSEPLLSGFMYNGSSYVRSTEKLYRAVAQSQQNPVTGLTDITYQTQEVPDLKGVFAATASATGDVYWAVTSEGIYEAAGSAPQSITDGTLFPLFVHGGQQSSAVNGFNPIDFTQPTKIRPFYTRGALYLLYQDTSAGLVCWKYDRTIVSPFQLSVSPVPTPGWFPISWSGVSPLVIYGDELEGSTDVLMSGSTGIVYRLGQGTSDNGAAISFNFQTPAYDLGDPRAQKLALDYMLDVNPAGVSFSAQLLGNNLGTSINTNTITGSGRQQFPETAIQSTLNLYRNFGLLVSGTTTSGLPTFYEFEPNVLLQPYVALNFSNQYQSHQFTNYGHIRDGWIMLISTSTVTLTITVDGGTPYSFSIPSTGGLPRKLYLFDQSITQPAAANFQRKGKLFLYSCTSTSPFALYTEETIINCKEWGTGSAYQPFRPFMGQTA